MTCIENQTIWLDSLMGLYKTTWSNGKQNQLWKNDHFILVKYAAIWPILHKNLFEKRD
jgi:hypothetical protein